MNQHLYGKILLLSEEAVWAGNKHAEGVLKTMITDKQMLIEAKGVNAVKSDSFCRLAFVSNEEHAVPASVDERRFFNIRVSSEKANNDDYFAKLKHEIDNGGREAFMYYLLNLKYSEEQIRRPPRTQVLMEDIVASMDAFERWLYADLLRKDVYDHIDGLTSRIWVDQIPIKTLEAEYKYFLEYNAKNYIGKDPIVSKDAFTKKFRSFFSDVDIEKRRSSKIGYFFENIDKHILRDSFEKQYNVRVEWDDCEKDDDPRIANENLMKSFTK